MPKSREAEPRRRAVARWAWPVACAPVLIAAYYLLGYAGASSSFVEAVYSSSTAIAIAGLCVAARRQTGRARDPWLLLAGGQAVMMTGNGVHHLLSRYGEVPYPSPADAFYLLGYLAPSAALALLVRRRMPDRRLPTMIDAAVVAISAGLLGWVYLVAPMAAGLVESSVEAQAVSLLYPIMDLVLLTVGLRLMLGAGARSVSYWLLACWLTTTLAADTAYSVQALLGVYDGAYVDGAWMFASLCLAAAGLHPSAARLAEPLVGSTPRAGRGRLAVLAAASIVAPVVLAVQHQRGAPLHVPEVVVVCIALFALVIARMADLLETQRRMAITDGLTGLHTRRHLDAALRQETERSCRSGAPVGFLLVDVDHFKKLNDTYGHQAGDRVLVELGRRLRSLARAGDVVARFGGEEFAVLLPGASMRELSAIAERLHRGLTAEPYPIGDGRLLRVTVSVGAAGVSPEVRLPDDLVRVTDEALYAAKHAGRDQVVLAGGQRRT